MSIEPRTDREPSTTGDDPRPGAAKTDDIVRAGGPPTPSRVRMVRPQFYRSEATGSLPPHVRDLLIGLTTIADDEGWLLWRPAEVAATIYPYTAAGARLRDLERRARALIERGVVMVEPCGCAFLPSLKEQHGVKSGRQTAGVWGWHMRHAAGRGIPGNTEEGSSSGSSSSSVSDRDSGSSSSRAGATEPSAVCLDCRRPTSKHAPDCPILHHPALAKVVG